MGANGSTGPEAIAAAEKIAAVLTARASARDPSEIPSICRVSAALQYHAGRFGASEISTMNRALLESMGANGSTRPEAIAAAEKIVAVLTARASARDPSEIRSICRVSAAL
ncbi:Augmin subunit [Thalictrum thalictroides]|uniref:Augmin subunit n=1 Tax=Thalictrum thalictroides TaxID=46969 RepID=A0A7J6X7S5_THATH|nr:Augmin subunit [Thalictrum thalictroides]